ncbi:MAG TPA: hypothetical protein VGF33_03630, partial [Caulobacteraceae bacterium]
FVLITNYDLSGSFENNGIIGGFTTPIGIQVDAGSIITSELINETGGKIFASQQGIAVVNSTVPNIVNDGSITVVNAHSGVATGIVYIDTVGAIPSSFTSTITNNGSMSVDSIGLGATSANATALGMGQKFVAEPGSVDANLVNNGDLSVSAQAVANAPTAHATAFGIGNLQQVSAAGAVTLTAANNGTLDVNVSATALGANTALGTASAHAVGIGFQQTAVAGTTGAGGLSAAGAVSNSGLVDIQVKELANAFNASAGGTANGFGQLIVAGGGTSLAFASFLNDGTFQVVDSAVATAAHSAFASAHAYGGEQTAVGGGGFVLIGGGDTATLTNTGVFTVEALANADGLNFALASASAGGVRQIAADGLASGTATDDFTNSGAFTVLAQATAVSPTLAVADANIVAGVSQIAVGFQGASVSIDNSATMSFIADATATSLTGDAQAVAVVTEGLYQVAVGTTFGSGASVANASVTNSGEITIAAQANAVAADLASAVAAIDPGISQ